MFAIYIKVYYNGIEDAFDLCRPKIRRALTPKYFINIRRSRLYEKNYYCDNEKYTLFPGSNGEFLFSLSKWSEDTLKYDFDWTIDISRDY